MISSLLLFPGILFHEFSHLLMCVLLSVRIKKVRVSLDSGFVTHEVPKSIIKSILVGIAPSIFSIAAAYLILNYYLPMQLWMDVIRYYFVFVILYTSLPSKEDTDFHQYHNIVKKVFTFPLFVVFRVFYYFGKNYYFRVFYTVLVIFLCLFYRIVF